MSDDSEKSAVGRRWARVEATALKDEAEKAATQHYGTSHSCYRDSWLDGAAWQRANLPRCGTCRYYNRSDTGDGMCDKNIRQTAHNRVTQDYGCNLHSELEGEK